MCGLTRVTPVGAIPHGMGPRTRPLGDSDLIDLAYLLRLILLRVGRGGDRGQRDGTAREKAAA